MLTCKNSARFHCLTELTPDWNGSDWIGQNKTANLNRPDWKVTYPYRLDLAPCKKAKLYPVSCAPLFWLIERQILTKFLNVEGYRLQNIVSSFNSKFSGIIDASYNCRGSSENCYITKLAAYLVRFVSFQRYTCLTCTCHKVHMSHFLRIGNSSQFMTTHGNELILLLSFNVYCFRCWAWILIKEHSHLIDYYIWGHMT